MNNTMSKKEKILYYLFILLSIVIYSYILPYDVMDIDSAQYAEISREMVENKNYFFIRDNGKKYLDKPILTFWIISFFYKLFGIHNFSFRLSALIFGILATFGIYKISQLLYKNQSKSLLATLLFSTSPGLFTFILNPLIDIYLICFLIFSFYFYYLGIKKNSNYFYLMYLCIGLGFITKGPISLMIPLISIGGNIILTRNWELLRKLKILYGIIIVLIPILLWSYFLYLDFGIYGPYFFLYLQSFGRFFSKIYDTGLNPFYFYFTFTFLILPYIAPFIISLILGWKELFKDQKTLKEKIIYLYKFIYKKDITLFLWVFLILFLLSFSRFKLPQYVFWITPAASILAGNLIEKYYHNKKISFSFYFTISTILILFFYIYFYSKLEISLFVLFISIIIIGILFWWKANHPLFLTISITYIFYSYIISVLYPYLISYQPASKISNIILKEDQNQLLKQKYLFTYGISLSNKSYSFYSKSLTKDYFFNKKEFFENLQKNSKVYIVIHQYFLEEFKKEIKKLFDDKIEIIEIQSFPSLKVSKPKIEYFDPIKKEKFITKIYLVKISIKN